MFRGEIKSLIFLLNNFSMNKRYKEYKGSKFRFYAWEDWRHFGPIILKHFNKNYLSIVIWKDIFSFAPRYQIQTFFTHSVSAWTASSLCTSSVIDGLLVGSYGNLKLGKQKDYIRVAGIESVCLSRTSNRRYTSSLHQAALFIPLH